MSKKWVNNVLRIVKTKKGGINVTFTKDPQVFQEFISSIKPGGRVHCIKKEDDLKKQLDSGRINDEKYVELQDKFLSWLKYEGHLMPESTEE